MPSYALLFVCPLLMSSSLAFVIGPITFKQLLPALGEEYFNQIFFAHGGGSSLGFIYSFVLCRFVPLSRQVVVHVVFWTGLAVVLFVLWPTNAVTPETRWFLLGPFGGAMALCTANFLMLVHWYQRSAEHVSGRDPYFLLSAVFLGGLVGLVVYPLFIEPVWPLKIQMLGWRVFFGGLGLLVLVSGWIAMDLVRESEQVPEEIDWGERPRSPTITRGLRWALLSAVAAGLCMGGTNYVTAEISIIPFTNLQFIGLYAMAGVAAFARSSAPGLKPGLYALAIRLIGTGILVPLFLFNLQFLRGIELSLFDWALTIYVVPLVWIPYRAVLLLQPFAVAIVLFQIMAGPGIFQHPYGTVCLHMVVVYLVARMCLGELAQSRPDGRYLVGFFFWSGLGIFAGRLFTEWLAPLIFAGITEYPLALLVGCFLRPGWLKHGFSDRLFAKLKFPEGNGAGVTVVLDFLLPLAIGLAAFLIFRSSHEIKPEPVIYAGLVFACLLLVGRPLRFGLALALVYMAHLSFSDCFINPDIKNFGL